MGTFEKNIFSDNNLINKSLERKIQKQLFSLCHNLSLREFEFFFFVRVLLEILYHIIQNKV
jgi:hypothetical protein